MYRFIEDGMEDERVIGKRLEIEEKLLGENKKRKEEVSKRKRELAKKDERNRKSFLRYSENPCPLMASIYIILQRIAK